MLTLLVVFHEENAIITARGKQIRHNLLAIDFTTAKINLGKKQFSDINSRDELSNKQILEQDRAICIKITCEPSSPAVDYHGLQTMVDQAALLYTQIHFNPLIAGAAYIRVFIFY